MQQPAYKSANNISKPSDALSLIKHTIDCNFSISNNHFTIRLCIKGTNYVTSNNSPVTTLYQTDDKKNNRSRRFNVSTTQSHPIIIVTVVSYTSPKFSSSSRQTRKQTYPKVEGEESRVGVGNIPRVGNTRSELKPFYRMTGC